MMQADIDALARRWGTPERLEEHIKSQFPRVARMTATEACELQGLVRTLTRWRTHLQQCPA
jgi:hypothetical protein